jgi:hypothetical protein
MKQAANRNIWVWHGRQRTALERGTPPTLMRRTCSPRYGLHSCQFDWAGVARQPRHLPPESYFSDSQLFHRSSGGYIQLSAWTCSSAQTLPLTGKGQASACCHPAFRYSAFPDPGCLPHSCASKRTDLKHPLEVFVVVGIDGLDVLVCDGRACALGNRLSLQRGFWVPRKRVYPNDPAVAAMASRDACDCRRSECD